VCAQFLRQHVLRSCHRIRIVFRKEALSGDGLRGKKADGDEGDAESHLEGLAAISENWIMGKLFLLPTLVAIALLNILLI
jgi:hypothetical protein